METSEDNTVLVVDDDSGITDALAIVLEDEGYRPVVAANGHEGLAYLRAHAPPCLIVLDLMMPVMDGYDFRAAPRADPALASIPVVVASAGALDARVQAMGAAATFRKPIELDEFLNAVARHRARAPQS